ncbi:glycosyltransferase [Wenzhouxiangella sp. AB-CW3]|uniref:glycosyltransferase n=1 Tax=Wenzhouxiangella sp. AB-CW3 TaxID=2771012 RepID=UPI00168A5C48|nr:glycosyltransferase [Wenzhouxiangella sp. AB-CW3]QOC21446.1 glycosyltransferase [Wenzhouxiangella sp. AB-CW3]
MAQTADDPFTRLSAIIPLGPGDRADELASVLQHHPRINEVIVSAAEAPPPGDPVGDHWIHGTTGRGVQLNRGAAAATGSWIWFVHADSRLSAETIAAVAGFASDATAVIGYCRLRFSSDGPWLANLNAFGANLRSRIFRQPYGDQGLCMPMAVFQQLKGFREDLDRGEDLDFVVRANMSGIPIRSMGATITTSARRYREQGWMRTTWQHQLAAARLIRKARRAGYPDNP